MQYYLNDKKLNKIEKQKAEKNGQNRVDDFKKLINRYKISYI